MSIVFSVTFICFNIKIVICEEKKEPEKPLEPEPPQDPKDCKIASGRDTTIEFQKDKDKGIGFIIAGGSDTPLVSLIKL